MLTRSRLASVFARAFAGPAEHVVAAPTTVGVRPRCMRHVAGCDVSPDLAYHTGHVWAREVAPRRFAVGIDDFAARLFGEATRVTPLADYSVVGVELPALATGLAAIIGVAAAFGLGVAAARSVRGPSPSA